MMTITIKTHIDREHLVWAAWYLLAIAKQKRLSKKQIVQFLKEQIAEYGNGALPENLFGTYFDVEKKGQDLERAEMFVAKAYPNTI